jgi:hypothetical protein
VSEQICFVWRGDVRLSAEQTSVGSQKEVANKWKPEAREKFWTFGDEPDDPVESLRWGSDSRHDAELAAKNKVFRN